MARKKEVVSITKTIQEAMAKYLAKIGHEAVCENFGHLFEIDVASISRSGMLHEFEVKISRSDFAADRKKGTRYGGKSKWEYYQTEKFKSPNYFCYVCPENMIAENEVPAFSGLYYYSELQGIYMVKAAKRIHSTPQGESIFKKMLRLHTQRKYLGGAMLTIKNQEAVRRYNEYTATIKS